MPIVDRYSRRVVVINTGRQETVFGHANRGVKTGLDSRAYQVCCEVSLDPRSGGQVVTPRHRTNRAYDQRTNSIS